MPKVRLQLQSLAISSVDKRCALLLDNSVSTDSQLLSLVSDLIQLGETDGLFPEDKKVDIIANFLKNNRKLS